MVVVEDRVVWKCIKEKQEREAIAGELAASYYWLLVAAAPSLARRRPGSYLAELSIGLWTLLHCWFVYERVNGRGRSCGWFSKIIKWTKNRVADTAPNFCQHVSRHQFQQNKQLWKVSSHARVTSIQSSKQEWVSLSVSDKGNHWSHSGQIKNHFNREVISCVFVSKVIVSLVKKYNFSCYHFIEVTKLAK